MSDADDQPPTSDKPPPSTTIHASTFTRTVLHQPITYTCVACENDVTELRLPGPAPKYCPTCRNDSFLKRERARQRKADQRRRRAAAPDD